MRWIMDGIINKENPIFRRSSVVERVPVDITCSFRGKLRNENHEPEQSSVHGELGELLRIRLKSLVIRKSRDTDVFYGNGKP